MQQMVELGQILSRAFGPKLAVRACKMLWHFEFIFLLRKIKNEARTYFILFADLLREKSKTPKV